MTWKARFKFITLGTHGVLCQDTELGKSQLFLLYSPPWLCPPLGGNLHACGHSNPHIQTPSLSPPSQTATPRPHFKPTRGPTNSLVVPPPRENSSESDPCGPWKQAQDYLGWKFQCPEYPKICPEVGEAGSRWA